MRFITARAEPYMQAAGVLVYSLHTKRFLVGKRGLHGDSPNVWAPFGGKVEVGETACDAALRELYEEAGLAVLPSSVQSEPLYVWQPNPDFVFTTFLAWVGAEPELAINEESSGYQWVTLEDMRMLDLHPGFRDLLNSVELEDIHAFLPL